MSGARIVPTREGYDLWAETYDEIDNWMLALEEPETDRALGEVRDRTVLDVGTGTGRHAIRLAERGARVTATDFSMRMLGRAVAKPGAERVRFIAHDLAHPLPFRDASFDLVLCAMVLEHVAEPEPFFAQLARVARPGARIVVTTMHPAMFLKGISAGFVLGDAEVRPRSYVASISDYVMAALRADLRVVALSEHTPDERFAERYSRARKWIGWPALLVMTLARPL